MFQDHIVYENSAIWQVLGLKVSLLGIDEEECRKIRLMLGNKKATIWTSQTPIK